MPKSLPDFTFSDARSPGFKSVETAANGDILVEGWAARYELDREDEAFEEGAFSDSIQTFMQGNRQVCYFHDLTAQVGQVEELKLIRGRGLWAKSRIFHQPEGSKYRHIYDNVRRGVCNGYSIGGYFSRRMGPDGRPRIYKCDVVELSITGSPVGGHGTTFNVLAGKAIASADAEMKSLRDDVELAALRVQVAQLRDRYQQHAQTGVKSVPARPAQVERLPEDQPTRGDDLGSLERQQRWEARRREILAGRYAAEDRARAAGDPVPIWLDDVPTTVPYWFERIDGTTTVHEVDGLDLEPGEIELPINTDIWGRPLAPPMEQLLTPEEQLAIADAPEKREGIIARVKARFKPREDIEPVFASTGERTYVLPRQPSPEDTFRRIAERNAPLDGETAEQTHARIARYDQLEAGLEND